MTWRHSDKYVFLHLIDGECLPNDLIICKGFFSAQKTVFIRVRGIERNDTSCQTRRRDIATGRQGLACGTNFNVSLRPVSKSRASLYAGRTRLTYWTQGHVKMRPVRTSRASLYAGRMKGTLLRDARDLLAGHFERCPYMRDARDLLTGRRDTLKCVP